MRTEMGSGVVGELGEQREEVKERRTSRKVAQPEPGWEQMLGLLSNSAAIGEPVSLLVTVLLVFPPQLINPISSVFFLALIMAVALTSFLPPRLKGCAELRASIPKLWDHCKNPTENRTGRTGLTSTSRAALNHVSNTNGAEKPPRRSTNLLRAAEARYQAFPPCNVCAHCGSLFADVETDPAELGQSSPRHISGNAPFNARI